jgi:peptidoglycan/LPS O-acetylase OafA/YrhL
VNTDIPRPRSAGLDVARALAILLVLAAHFASQCLPWFGLQAPAWLEKAGGQGVALFFALSGFLIGRLLIGLSERPTLRGWWIFMVRRWMRTLPAYLAWIAVLAVFWQPAGELGEYALSYATLTQNLAWPMPADNWFGVSWSLAVEEWFYLLFSVTFLSLAVLLGRSAGFWVAVAAFIAIPTFARWLVGFELGPGVRVVALRLDAIAYGVVMAKLTVDRSILVQRPFALLGVGASLVGFVWAAPVFEEPNAWRLGMFTLRPLGWALCLPAFLALAGLPKPLARAALGVSLLSFSLYIVHLSIIRASAALMSTFQLPAIACMLLAIGGTIAASLVLHALIERPFMALRPRQTSGRETLGKNRRAQGSSRKLRRHDIAPSEARGTVRQG